jgi:hypothetical protein
MNAINIFRNAQTLTVYEPGRGKGLYFFRPLTATELYMTDDDVEKHIWRGAWLSGQVREEHSMQEAS